MEQSNEVKQLAETVSTLALSLQQSQKHARRLERLFSIVVFALFSGILTVFLSNSSIIGNAHADNHANMQMQMQMQKLLQTLGPALIDASVLIKRLKQDSDIMRSQALRTRYPKQYGGNTPIDQKTLNSKEASDALIVGSLAKEVHFVNESLKRMNYSISIMARNMNSTLGRFGTWMP